MRNVRKLLPFGKGLQLRRYDFMLEWGQTINNEMLRLSAFLNRMNIPNALPTETADAT